MLMPDIVDKLRVLQRVCACRHLVASTVRLRYERGNDRLSYLSYIWLNYRTNVNYSIYHPHVM